MSSKCVARELIHPKSMKNYCQKIKIISQSTFESFSQNTFCERKQKKTGKCKIINQNFDLMHFVKVKVKNKKIRKRASLNIYKNSKPYVLKQKRNCSKLKRRILKYRLLKKSRLGENLHSTSNLTQIKIESVTARLQNLSLEHQINQSQLHSRRFREYCDNITSPNLCSLVEMLLRELNKFQKRSFQNNEYKGKSRRRLVCGFREVQNYININKLKLVIIATDCESCSAEGSLDSIIWNLKESCRKNEVPHVFAFSRRQLAYILLKKKIVSVVGITNYDGAQDIFVKIQEALEIDKCEETTKKVSSMNYYAYRLMIRQNADSYLLRFRRLFQQYCVDMYVTIETERLTFIRLNQAKLRSEEYIHLRDAIGTERNAANIGRLTILPATYIGSPRHMHEYAQDLMTYVRHYGRPDLFITFTCNPKWIEIVQLLLPGQTSSDRHDITAQKMRSLMNYIVKQRVFEDTRCYVFNRMAKTRPAARTRFYLVIGKNSTRPNR